MNNQISARERQHLANVKALACSVCDAPPPSEAPTHWRLERRFVPNMTAEEAAARKDDWHVAVARVRSA